MISSLFTDPGPIRPQSRVIAFAGPSNSGKTGLICHLVSWLRQRNLKVAVLKHSHKLNLGDTSKDTGRYRTAGANLVALAAPGVLQVTRLYGDGPSLDKVLADLCPEVDLVLVEGYKSSAIPKVAVLGPESAPVLPDYPGLVAVVGLHLPASSLPHFHPDQVEDLGRFLLRYLGFEDGRLHS